MLLYSNKGHQSSGNLFGESLPKHCPYGARSNRQKFFLTPAGTNFDSLTLHGQEPTAQAVMIDLIPDELDKRVTNLTGYKNNPWSVIFSLNLQKRAIESVTGLLLSSYEGAWDTKQKRY